jgi:hypothetical protein
VDELAAIVNIEETDAAVEVSLEVDEEDIIEAAVVGFDDEQ